MQWLILLALPLCVCRAAGAGETPSAEDLRRMIADSVASRRIQDKLPGEQERRVVRQESRRGYYIETGERPASMPQGAATIMFWIALGVLLVILALTLRDNLRAAPSASKKRALPGDPKDAEKTGERMRIVRLEGDELAEQGDFAAAMHLLLLKSIEEMRRRLGVPMAISLTSREILDRTKLDALAHDSLADIVGRVEISYFGTHAPGAEEYAQCRSSYSTLIRVLGGGVRA